MPGETSIMARKEPDTDTPARLPVGIRDLVLSPYPGITYYDIPPLKPTVYKWETAAAFFCNGVAGGAQMLAAISESIDGRQSRSIVRAGRYIAATGGLLSTALLISELHTRQRWFNMLRLFKSTSAMSIGIWSITPFVALSTLTAVGQAAEDIGYENPGRLMGKIFGIPAAGLGAVVMTYMGTELEQTNIPLWADAYPLLAPFYAAAGISNAAAALQIGAEMNNTPDAQKAMLNRIALVAGTVEMALATLIGRRWNKSPAAGFFKESVYNALFGFGFLEAGLGAPLISNLLKEGGTLEGGDTREGDRFFLVGPALKLAGGLLFQLIMIYAGKASGNQLKDYFEYAQLPAAANARKLPVKAKKQSPTTRSDSSPSLLTSALALGAAVIAGAALGLRQNKKRGSS